MPRQKPRATPPSHPASRRLIDALVLKPFLERRGLVFADEPCHPTWAPDQFHLPRHLLRLAPAHLSECCEARYLMTALPALWSARSQRRGWRGRINEPLLTIVACLITFAQFFHPSHSLQLASRGRTATIPGAVGHNYPEDRAALARGCPAREPLRLITH